MATTPPASPTSVGSSQQTLSEYAGPYVTSMLGKAEAVSEQPYQVYGGPQTAGESGLQSKVFQGLGNLNFPGQLGQTFSSAGAYQPPLYADSAHECAHTGAAHRDCVSVHEPVLAVCPTASVRRNETSVSAYLTAFHGSVNPCRWLWWWPSGHHAV